MKSLRIQLWAAGRRPAPLLWAFGLVALAASAQVPGILSHQGRLTVAGTNFTGLAAFKFALITTNAGNVQTLWSHDNTSVAGREPTGTAVSLAVTRQRGHADQPAGGDCPARSLRCLVWGGHHHRPVRGGRLGPD